MQIEIDANSGFCFGVVNAIAKAEQQLAAGGSLYCLGDIVHNSDEVDRLDRKGLRTITHSDFEQLRQAKVLLRAHGEPPTTYVTAKANEIEIVDATCPVVLQLQRRIKKAYDKGKDLQQSPLILIYGKRGHAEVNGLVGQTEGSAVVIQSEEELDGLDLNRDILLYSQTTKSRSGFEALIEAIKRRKSRGEFQYFDTICGQVANRMSQIREFAKAHEVVIFVCGKKSSNGRVLFSECKAVNPRSYMITNAEEINPQWTEGADKIGICGATSTPSWLMQNVKTHLENLHNSPHND